MLGVATQAAEEEEIKNKREEEKGEQFWGDGGTGAVIVKH
jgi:hypothetical protein